MGASRPPRSGRLFRSARSCSRLGARREAAEGVLRVDHRQRHGDPRRGRSVTRRVLVILGIVAVATVLAYALGAIPALRVVGSATGLYCTVTPSENDNGKSCFITEVEQ